jgi:hypothetical protein
MCTARAASLVAPRARRVGCCTVHAASPVARRMPRTPCARHERRTCVPLTAEISVWMVGALQRNDASTARQKRCTANAASNAPGNGTRVLRRAVCRVPRNNGTTCRSPRGSGTRRTVAALYHTGRHARCSHRYATRTRPQPAFSESSSTSSAGPVGRATLSESFAARTCCNTPCEPRHLAWRRSYTLAAPVSFVAGRPHARKRSRRTNCNTCVIGCKTIYAPRRQPEAPEKIVAASPSLPVALSYERTRRLFANSHRRNVHESDGAKLCQRPRRHRA